MTRSLNVAIVATELPYPPTAGNRIRTLNLALRLAARHRIAFIAHRNDESAEASRFLREYGIETVLVDRANPVKSGPRFYARLAANLASPVPYSVASHNSQALRRAVHSYARRHRIDVWQVEATSSSTRWPTSQRCPRVIIAHNVESLIWQRYFQSETDTLKRWYIKQQWRKFERFERRAFAAATRVVAVSEQDATLIRDRFGGRNVDVVDNGIDRDLLRGGAAGPRTRDDPLPGQPRLAAESRCRRTAAGPDLPGRAGRGARGPAVPGRPVAPSGARPQDRAKSRASSSTPTCPTSGPFWRPAGSWLFPCGSAEGRG